MDGIEVDTTQESAYATGSIGFQESPTEEATYRDLTVTSASGKKLFSDAFAPGEQNACSAGSIGADGLDVTNASAMLKPDNQTPRLREEFALRKKVKSARLYSSALGTLRVPIIHPCRSRV